MQITLDREGFKEIPNTLICRKRKMLVEVEGRKPCCWLCGDVGHMAKVCPSKKKDQVPPSPATSATTTAKKPEEIPKPGGEWTEVTSGRKSSSAPSPPQKEIPQKRQSEVEVKQHPKEGQNKRPEEQAKLQSQQQQKLQEQQPQQQKQEQRSQHKQRKQQKHPQTQQQQEAPMEVESMPPPRTSSLKRCREEDSEEQEKNISGRSRVERSMDRTRRRSFPASPIRHTVSPKDRSLPSSPTRTPSPSPSISSPSSVSTPPHTSTSSPPHPSREKKKKKKKLFEGPETICQVDKEEYTKVLSKHKRPLLKVLYKINKVDGKTTEDPRNFPKAPGVITCVRDTGSFLKVWSHLFEAKEPFPNIRMLEIDDPEIKKLRQFCAGRVPVLVHPSLYRAIKLTYPTDVGGIALDGRIMSELGVGSLGQSVGVLSGSDFRPVCE